MKKQKLFLIALLVVPWLAVPLLGRKAFKRFLPTAIFMCTFTKALDFYGEKKKWWKFYSGIGPFDSMNFMNFGPYLVTSLWVLKLTFGKLPLFIISNTLLHIIFIFGGLRFVEGFRIFSLERLTKFQYLVLSFFRALVLYAFQNITELTPFKKFLSYKK
ncbi:hypothetical protein M3226_05590 [Neobacillus cucumis]|uniref:hypothetical protein n=1 Tax=Neobacillus cucumis TaxID=1740721 RepID=UPI0020420C67|nr:hypothetical protein [Neobacillus cucumis]MCM3725172.1 hypothetical protein [Neobacillus cucumis]